VGKWALTAWKNADCCPGTGRRRSVGPNGAARSNSLARRDEALVCAFALTACVVHVLLDGRYGYFRDELYYAVCGSISPGVRGPGALIAVVARLTRAMFGDSLYALRLFPALSAGVKIVLAGWIVRSWRSAVCPMADGYRDAVLPNLSDHGQFSVHELIRAGILDALRGACSAHRANREPKAVALFGLAAGIGILNKHSMLLFGFGLSPRAARHPAAATVDGKMDLAGGSSPL